MSRDSPPIVELSDDSAVGSIAGSSSSQVRVSIRKDKPKLTRPSLSDLIVKADDLEQAALQMNTGSNLLRSSIRTFLSCFDDLDVQRFASVKDYLISFVSNGINKNPSTIFRPKSVLWPDDFNKIVKQTSMLDAFLLNTGFRERPINWMLERGLTVKPNCKLCKQAMSLSYEDNTVRWQCLKSSACSNFIIPIQRPSIFKNYENLSIDKLLFTLYYWSVCIPIEELHPLLNIEPHHLHSIWKIVQRVCRTALDKSYPRHRLTNFFSTNDREAEPEPIDLISIKLNNVYIVCAKHPRSNLVRLGLHIPKVSKYTFADLTESWFAHGAHVRVAEVKFLELNKKRQDLKVELVSPIEIVAKDGHYYRDSAFGYLTCQLAHVLKDFDSASLTREDLKLILAEMQWRELYGTTPLDAFTNIVEHIAKYSQASNWSSELSVPKEGEIMLESPINQCMEGSDYIWAESYFYATVEPVDSEGNIICRFTEPPNLERPPEPDVRMTCHDCKLRTECFDFSLHIIAHVEANRGDLVGKMTKSSHVQCKHCFKVIRRDEISTHLALFRTQYHTVRNGCRICCIKLPSRASYLSHMRRQHFEHETPYRCPSCKFASSFQRDVFIHFQEEHRHSMIALCPICLRSFTVKNPELMTEERMSELSKCIYNHISEHYAKGRVFACDNCCLNFLGEDALLNHQKSHHNPLEVIVENGLKIEPFIVTPKEEKFCVRALPTELFVSNKRPNEIFSTVGGYAKRSRKQTIQTIGSNNSWSDSDSSNDSLNENEPDNGGKETRLRFQKIYEESEEEETRESDIIHVRGGAQNFLQGGAPTLEVASRRTNLNAQNDELTSEKLIDYLSKMKRAEGVIPNRSVILSPDGTAVKCVECLNYVTTDHYVATLRCRDCKYATHCPRALTNHLSKSHKIQENLTSLS